MPYRSRVFLGALLGAAACFTIDLAHGAAPLSRSFDPRYETSCLIVNDTTVEGFVTNRTAAVLEVAGPVRFSFTIEQSMSRPAVQTQTATLVAPGRTVSVALAQMAGNILPSEACQLDVSAAVR